jgi:methyl-accepting chemotaxis protein
MGFLSHWFSKLGLAIKIQFIAVTALVSLLVLGGLSAVETYDIMWNARVDKIRSIAQAGVSVATELQSRVAPGSLTREQAIQQFRDTIRPIRFEGGAGYYFVYGTDGQTLVLGPTPNVEGTNRLNFKDTEGKPFVQAQIEVARSGGGTVGYAYPKPGSTAAEQKLSYVLPVPGWDMFVGTGLYVDDLRAAIYAVIERGSVIVLGLLLLCIVVAWLVSRAITRPLAALSSGMRALAEGRLDTVISGIERGDEIGDMARTIGVFKQGMAEADRLRIEREAAEARAVEATREARQRLADEFETRIGDLVRSVASAATEMQATAASMSSTADQANAQAGAVAVASEEASANVQTVASATEELTASVEEIGQHVQKSSHIATRAVADAKRTDQTVQTLATGAARIGDVVTLIQTIAGQTNLLALNATIEAARAGDAGKGFAVVASEVKSLAAQTARATTEIAGQVAAIQAATTETVAAIRTIIATIMEINDIAAVVAVAVEEQGAATREIARSVHDASQGTQQVSFNISGVREAASATGLAATEVREAAGDLSQQAEGLSKEVSRFIAGVKAA